MRFGTVPRPAIGLAAGLLTSTAVIALSATGLLPTPVSTPLLLFAGGLAAGLAAPVRPTIGALLGAVTGIFTALPLTIVYLVQMASVSSPYPSPPFALIAGASVILFVPLNAAAGALGAAVRLLVGLRDAPAERTADRAPAWRQWVGIAVGALCILPGMWAGILIGMIDPFPMFLVFALAGGFAAGILSAGGARAGIGSGLLAGVFGISAVALYFIRQASMATGHGLSEGLWQIAIVLMAFWVLPAAALGGALGGSFRKSSGPPPALADQDRDKEGEPARLPR